LQTVFFESFYQKDHQSKKEERKQLRALRGEPQKNDDSRNDKEQGGMQTHSLPANAFVEQHDQDSEECCAQIDDSPEGKQAVNAVHDDLTEPCLSERKDLVSLYLFVGGIPFGGKRKGVCGRQGFCFPDILPAFQVPPEISTRDRAGEDAKDTYDSKNEEDDVNDFRYSLHIKLEPHLQSYIRAVPQQLLTPP